MVVVSPEHVWLPHEMKQQLQHQLQCVCSIYYDVMVLRHIA